MYALNLRNPMTAARTAVRARDVRDDVELPSTVGPDIGFVDEPTLDADAPVVQSVTPVDPQMKKFRATVCRTVTQSAIVEYEALETQGQHSVAEDLAAQVPDESWTTDPSNSWCYIDRLEDLGPTGAADPAIETADDDTLETDPADPAAQNIDDEDAPFQAGRTRHRRARDQRAEPETVIAQAQDILDQASAAYSSLGTEGADPQSIVDTLQQLLQQIQGLQDNAEGDMSGSEADIDSQVSAVQFVNDAAQQIEEMMEEAQADVISDESEAA